MPSLVRAFSVSLTAFLLWIAMGGVLVHEARGDDYVFTDAGEIFGDVPEHFGRANAWGDLDGDGLWDLVTGSHNLGLRAFRQIDPLHFERVDLVNGLSSRIPLYGILILDFDRDGDNDVFLNHIGFAGDVVPTSTRFMRNDGQGNFTDDTENAGVSSFASGFGLVALDYDRDGWVDVYVVNHGSANLLFRNNRDGSFSDMTSFAGVDAIGGRLGRATSAAAFDFDRDGWMDLYVGQRDNIDEEYSTGNSQLLRNRGDGTFENLALQAGVEGVGDDFVVTVEDFDNDLWEDLYVSTFNFGPNGEPTTQNPNRLYLNNQDGSFRDVTSSHGANYIGGTMGCGAFDHDNDTWADLYVGNGGPFSLQVEDQIFYHNLGDAYFRDETIEKGLYDDARGHGNSMLDYDRDGDLDIFASLGGHTENSYHLDILYLNSGGPGHWLELQLRGDDCPLEGLGVAVTLFSGEERWRRVVRASGGFDSQAVPHVWFGLGGRSSIDKLQVKWPCGRTELVSKPGVDQHLVLREGESPLAVEEPSDEDPVMTPSLTTLSLRPLQNPFRGSVEMVATLGPYGQTAEISVLDLRGRRIRSTMLELAGPRELRWTWDGRDLQGRTVAAGRYLVELRHGGRRVTSPVTLLR